MTMRLLKTMQEYQMLNLKAGNMLGFDIGNCTIGVSLKDCQSLTKRAFPLEKIGLPTLWAKDPKDMTEFAQKILNLVIHFIYNQ
jgi:RNase H-fold protein (predicted Holliday junction resolvase)